MTTDRRDESFYRELLESVVETSPDLVYFKDTDHELVYYGESYANIFGDETESLLGRTAWDLWPEDEAREIVTDEERALSGNRVVGREREVTHPDGSLHWYSIHKLPQYDENGSVAGFSAIDREITDRKNDERELKRFRSLVEHSGDVIALFNERGVIEYVSPAVEKIFGYKPAQLTGTETLDLIHPDDVEEVAAAFNQLVVESSDFGSIEARFRTADGEWTWIETTGVHRPEIDGIEGVLLVARDISERKEREREWHRMKRAVDASGHAIYITDTDATIEYVNPAFETVTGYSSSEAVGNTPKIMKSGEMSDDHYAELWAHLKAGKIWNEEVINQRKSGKLYHAQQTIAPIRKNGTITAYVAIQTDITDRIELKERLSVVNRILRHDIRSAVSIIRGNAELALNSRGSVTRILETIRSEANRLYRLGENARYMEGAWKNTEPQTEVVDLAELVPASALSCRNENPNATVTFDVPKSAPVRASASLDEALSELCSNAIVHNDAEERQVSVTVSYPADDDVATVEVTDNGPGIPEAEVEPLEQGIESSLEHTSGLGLWVVHWIVEESRGELEFDENKPEGSIVRIRLPKAA
ncbi:MAG: PAS domain S-box protein [Halodesulfurarchaeum sp.]|nr:PAS domain S-box protein [Halodesulfurarchaeum sp.]